MVGVDAVARLYAVVMVYAVAKVYAVVRVYAVFSYNPTWEYAPNCLTCNYTMIVLLLLITMGCGIY